METGNDIFSTNKSGISKVYFTLLCENENDDVYSVNAFSLFQNYSSVLYYCFQGVFIIIENVFEIGLYHLTMNRKGISVVLLYNSKQLASCCCSFCCSENSSGQLNIAEASFPSS